jgi:hypothetical protein
MGTIEKAPNSKKEIKKHNVDLVFKEEFVNTFVEVNGVTIPDKNAPLAVASLEIKQKGSFDKEDRKLLDKIYDKFAAEFSANKPALNAMWCEGKCELDEIVKTLAGKNTNDQQRADAEQRADELLKAVKSYRSK